MNIVVSHRARPARAAAPFGGELPRRRTGQDARGCALRTRQCGEPGHERGAGSRSPAHGLRVPAGYQGRLHRQSPDDGSRLPSVAHRDIRRSRAGISSGESPPGRPTGRPARSGAAEILPAGSERLGEPQVGDTRDRRHQRMRMTVRVAASPEVPATFRTIAPRRDRLPRLSCDPAGRGRPAFGRERTARGRKVRFECCEM